MPAGEGLLNLSRDDIVYRLREAGLDDVAPYLELLQQSIWMRIDPDRKPELLESRFGGPAMVPEGFSWPMYVAEPYMGRDPNDGPDKFVLWYAKQQQLPMFHIAQLNLAKIPIESALPRAGLLSIFTDPFDGVWGHARSDQQGVRIQYTPQEALATLHPQEMPSRSHHHGAFKDRTWPCYAIEYFLKWTMSDWVLYRELLDKDSNPNARSRMQDLWKEVFGYPFGQFLLDGGRNHQEDPRESAVLMFDPPMEPADDASPDDYQLYQDEVARRASDWTTLFSIMKDDHLNPVVSDTGGLSILIRKADLAARRFDRPWIVRS